MCEREEGDKRKERCGRKKGRQIGANMQERGEGERRAKETKRRGREVNQRKGERGVEERDRKEEGEGARQGDVKERRGRGRTERGKWNNRDRGSTKTERVDSETLKKIRNFRILSLFFTYDILNPLKRNSSLKTPHPNTLLRKKTTIMHLT
ncbi:hypothetical protein AAZX31_20G204100 [Glycine max]